MQATSLAPEHLLHAVGDPVAERRDIGPDHPEFNRAQTIRAAAGVLAKVPDTMPAIAQALRTWRFNPQWQAQQRGIANSAVQQDNIRSQQIQSRALKAIAEDQRQTSDTIMKGWEQRQKIYDEISRKRENAILGTLDVIDPQSGIQYKVSNFGDYHYMSNEGYIYSTNVPGAPAPNLREMITLP